MGWYFGYFSRDAIIKELTEPSDWVNPDGKKVERRTLAHCCQGNVLWSVQENFLEGVSQGRWIQCDLMKRYKAPGEEAEWGYKPMEESMHPYYYTCPLKYLDMVPDGSAGVSPEWRAKVRAYHAERKRKLSVGAHYYLKGVRGPSWVTLVSLRPLVGTDKFNQRWRLRKKHIGEAFLPLEETCQN